MARLHPPVFTHTSRSAIKLIRIFGNIFTNFWHTLFTTSQIPLILGGKVIGYYVPFGIRRVPVLLIRYPGFLIFNLQLFNGSVAVLGCVLVIVDTLSRISY
jgi:hypothetical protein